MLSGSGWLFRAWTALTRVRGVELFGSCPLVGVGDWLFCVSGSHSSPYLFSDGWKPVFAACSGTVSGFGGGNGLSRACKASALAPVSFVTALQSIGLCSDPLTGLVLRLFSI